MTAVFRRLKLLRAVFIWTQASSPVSWGRLSRTVQKAVGRIVGELAPTYLREPHAPGALRLGQEKGRIMLQGASGGGGLAERAYQPADKIARNSPLLNPHDA